MKIIIYILIIFSISQVKLKSDELEFIPMKDLAIYNEMLGSSIFFLLGPTLEFPLFSMKTEAYLNHQLNYRVGANIHHLTIFGVFGGGTGANYSPLGFQYYVGKDNYYLDLGFELIRYNFLFEVGSFNSVPVVEPSDDSEDVNLSNREYFISNFLNAFYIGYRYQGGNSIFKVSIYIVNDDIQYIPWISLSFGYNIP